MLLAFGLGMPARIAFGVIHGFVPIALFTVGAAQNVKPALIKTARVLKFDWFDMVPRVLFRMAGCRVSRASGIDGPEPKTFGAAQSAPPPDPTDYYTPLGTLNATRRRPCLWITKRCPGGRNAKI